MRKPIFGLLLLFTLLLFVTPQRASCNAPKVNLPIVHKEFVSILVGNPGKYLKLRLSFSLEETVVLFSSPATYSKTYLFYEGTNRGSDVLYMGPYANRFPILFDSSKMEYDTKVRYDGILCLGTHSHLWLHWQRYTFSSTSLLLGMYDQTLARRNYMPFEIHCDFDGYANITIDDEQYHLYYDPGDKYTRLPPKLYHNPRHVKMFIDQNSAHHVMQLDYDDYVIHMPTGFDYSMLRKQPSGSKDIVLGQYSTTHLISHSNVISGTREIHPAYDLYTNGDTQPCFNSTSGLLVCVILVFWLAMVLSDRLADRKRVLTCSRVEIYSYVAASLLVFIEITSYKVGRYVYHHMAYNDSNFFAPYTVLVVLFWVNTLAGAILAVVKVNSTHTLCLRRCFLESTLVLALWLLCISEHRTIYDHLMLVSISSIYCVLRLLSALSKALRWWKTKTGMTQLIVLTAYAVLSALFVIFYNILPFLDRFWYGFPDRFVSSTYVFVLFVALPCLYLFNEIRISMIRNTEISFIQDQSSHLHL